MFLILVILTVVGCGLMGGLFFVFSNSVMKALGQLPAPQGIAAMQAINRTIVNPLFLIIFMGTAVLCLFMVMNAIAQWFVSDTIWMITGGVFYLFGTFLVTVVFNVPWNDELAAAKAEDPRHEVLWAEYLSKWTAWNHVRTIGAVGSTIFFMIALCKSFYLL